MKSEKRARMRKLVTEGDLPSDFAYLSPKLLKSAAICVDVLAKASAENLRAAESPIVETEHYENLPSPHDTAGAVTEAGAAGLQSLLVQLGAGSLIPELAPYLSQFKRSLAEDCEVLDHYYTILRGKLVRLRNGKRISTGELQRLSIAITKITELRRKAFLLPFGAINPHAVKQQNQGGQHLHLHNFGNTSVKPRAIAHQEGNDDD